MSEDTAAAGDEEKSRDFIWQSGDTHAETNVNSSRHAARVAPEILHRTEAPRAALQGCGERMCGAMEADPFEQPYWNLDQYLIWLASRDPAAVPKAIDRPNSGANPGTVRVRYRLRTRCGHDIEGYLQPCITHCPGLNFGV